MTKPAQDLCEMLVRLRDEVLCRRHAEKEALRRADQALPPPRRTLLLRAAARLTGLRIKTI